MFSEAEVGNADDWWKNGEFNLEVSKWYDIFLLSNAPVKDQVVETLEKMLACVLTLRSLAQQSNRKQSAAYASPPR